VRVWMRTCGPSDVPGWKYLSRRPRTPSRSDARGSGPVLEARARSRSQPASRLSNTTQSRGVAADERHAPR
jgi:hypothetical protein